METITTLKQIKETIDNLLYAAEHDKEFPLVDDIESLLNTVSLLNTLLLNINKAHINNTK